MIKGLETAGAGESSWLQNMKKKVFITCFNKKETTSMRAQHTAEAILREVYSKGRMCVRDLSLIALLKVGVFLVLLFLLWSIFLGGKISLTERDMGQMRNDGFFLAFLSLFLIRQYLSAIILKYLPSCIKCVLHGKLTCSTVFSELSILSL